MTKAEKKKRVTALSKALRGEGFKKDKWGTFKKDDFKVDLRKEKFFLFKKHEGKYRKEYWHDFDKMTPFIIDAVLKVLYSEVKK